MHKTERLGDWLDMYQFGLGALAFIITEIKAELEELGNTEAVELAEEAEQKQSRAAQLRYSWEQRKTRDPLERPGSKEIDNKIDSTLSNLLQAIEVFADLDSDSHETQMADELVDELFPSGVYPITSQTFTNQKAAVDHVLRELQGPYSEHVEALSLGVIVDRLEELNAQFGRALSDTTETVNYDEVEAAHVEAEDAFHRLFIRVLNDYADDLETLNHLLYPLHAQTRRTRRSLKRTGTRPDIDPETGEAVDGDSGDQSTSDGE